MSRNMKSKAGTCHFVLEVVLGGVMVKIVWATVEQHSRQHTPSLGLGVNKRLFLSHRWLNAEVKNIPLTNPLKIGYSKYLVQVWYSRLLWIIISLKYKTAWRHLQTRWRLLNWDWLHVDTSFSVSQTEHTRSTWLTWSKCFWCVGNKLQHNSYENREVVTKNGFRLCFRNNQQRLHLPLFISACPTGMWRVSFLSITACAWEFG